MFTPCGARGVAAISTASAQCYTPCMNDLALRIPVLTLFVLLSGCGLGRTVLDIQHPASAKPASAAPVALKLMTLVDARHFEAHPSQANIPSLNDDDVTNAALTARAVGRKRGSFGKARGDYMLPANDDVLSLTRQCVEAAVSRAGGVLVAQGDPRYERAIPLDVRLAGFWTWIRPGAWVVAAEFDAAVTLTAPLQGLAQGRTVLAHAEIRRPSITDGRVARVVQEGVATLTTQLERELSAVLSASAISSPSHEN